MDTSNSVFDAITATKPTNKQLGFLARLCRENEQTFVEPKTKAEACKMIDAEIDRYKSVMVIEDLFDRLRDDRLRDLDYNDQF